ncbi:HNH endonuclease [Sanguibacter sp. HDW7]|uniref:HNH endonuclease n=1 Tax=Sanguibacter sp. HDW7 TaxID=2714931 RepID=UPI001409B0C6|nr:HNH endonuclease [Sanguibacter sp. HDW7]QIK83099.1 HNH endonuclease [Sanguibacter sp. HDW7]
MRGRSGHAWRMLVAQLCPPGSYCEVAVCYAPTREILFGLRPRHPLGPSLDHVVEMWEGGDPEDPANLVPAHLTCNVRKSNARRAQARTQAERSRGSRVRTAALSAQPRRRRSSSILDDD